MCSVLELDSGGDIKRLTNYERYYLLDDDDKKALMVLCLALNPMELNGESRYLSKSKNTSAWFPKLKTL